MGRVNSEVRAAGARFSRGARSEPAQGHRCDGCDLVDCRRSCRSRDPGGAVGPTDREFADITKRSTNDGDCPRELVAFVQLMCQLGVVVTLSVRLDTPLS